ncbi:MAG TPA: hypothetical protein VFS66_15210 [Acidimicrobiia bacterium]|nr:hypothetical protein [Acidimicrobiia bacterium]
MDVIDWLLDSDPAIRWQVMAGLTDEAPETVAAERSRVADEGWGAQLLALQGEDGQWDGGTYRPGWVDDDKPFYDAWTGTHYSLQLLRDLGVDPEDPRVVTAITRVRDNVVWEFNGAPYFDGEAEPCINGIALGVGAYFGQEVDPIVEQLMKDQLGDGGWNCDAEAGSTVSSFHTTICVVEGLLAYERAGNASEEVAAVRTRGEEYLLERALFRSKSTGQAVDPRFTMLSFPVRWYHDILRGLDHFRLAGPFDDRCAEAVEMLVSKRDSEGRWRLENRHQGPVHFRVDGPEGGPSRWNTLRALRVLEWAGAD